jgi:hypothetical protein
MNSNFETTYHCIKEFLETGLIEYSRKINIPVLAIKGNDNQIITFQAARSKSADLYPKESAMVCYAKIAPHIVL